MMLEMAVGDAYGGCFEAANKGFVANNNQLAYVAHPRSRKKKEGDAAPLVPTGHYTDDTQMAIAVAEAMLDDNETWSVESMADRFVQTFRRDKRRGYTVFFFNVLLNSNNGSEMLSKINGKSTKSGAAMRSGPLGLYPDFQEVVRKAQLQASVTHDTWFGRHSAVGAALMTHYFYYDIGPKDELCGWLRDNWFSDTLHSPHPIEADGETKYCWSPIDGRVSSHAWDVLEAAIHAIEKHDSLSAILQQCVAYTGDVDTVAAIAICAASVSKEIKQDLPVNLVDGLEDRKYGKKYLEALDQKLFAKFPKEAYVKESRILLRFNTKFEQDDAKRKWRVLVDGEETLAHKVFTSVPCETITEAVANGEIRHHFLCYGKVEWRGDHEAHVLPL